MTLALGPVEMADIATAMEIHLTHIGGPTVLIEVGGWRVLTDPTFDPPGQSYRFGWGTGSRKLTGPALAASEIGPIDAVLLSHDHHEDNLDPAGRGLLPSAGTIITTVAGARRLGDDARGVEPWVVRSLAWGTRPLTPTLSTPSRQRAGRRKPSLTSDSSASSPIEWLRLCWTLLQLVSARESWTWARGRAGWPPTLESAGHQWWALTSRR
jgi:hypothetical protein